MLMPEGHYHKTALFDNFTSTHSKTYEDEAEATQRMVNLIHNTRFVNAKNRQVRCLQWLSLQ